MVNCAVFLPIEAEDKLDKLFAYQLDFMDKLGVSRTTGIKIKEEERELADRCLTQDTLPIAFALLDEVHEFVRELPWKPWKKKNKPADREKVKQELTDCWFFLLELSIMWGLDAKTLMEEYEKKLKINHERQNGGY